jgi:hypothetical protein
MLEHMGLSDKGGGLWILGLKYMMHGFIVFLLKSVSKSFASLDLLKFFVCSLECVFNILHRLFSNVFGSGCFSI